MNAVDLDMDDLDSEYDFSGAVRGKHYRAYQIAKAGIDLSENRKSRIPPPQFVGKVREIGDVMSSIPLSDWGIDE